MAVRTGGARGAEGTSTLVDLTSRPRDGAPVRITLVRPPVVVLLNSLSYVGPMPSIGMAYVAAVLRDAGHDITVIDAAGERLDQLHDFTSPSGPMRRIGLSPDEVVDRIPAGTQIIGITHMFLHEWPQVRVIAEKARARFPDALITLGGENASSYAPWIFAETDAVDLCVKGEGEATAVELAARVAAGASLAGMTGVALRPGFLDEEQAPSLPVRIRTLSEVPRPAWDLFPMEAYLSHPSTFGVDRGRTMPMLATRGCPYKCSFCSSPQMWTTRYIVRDPVDLVDEIEDYVERYQIDNVDFVDLTAMTKRRWTLDFCAELQRRGLDLTWQLPVGTRSESIDAEVLQALYDSGCRNITFAPEHGSPRMLEVFDKRLDLDHILESIRVSTEVGLITHVNTIIGHPAETWRDRWLNLRFLLRAARAGCHTATAIMFHPYPGSRDFQDLLDAGALVVDETFVYDGIARGGPSHHSWNPGISSRMLHLTQVGTMGAFFALSNILRPSRGVHFLKVALGGEERTIYEQGIRSKLRGTLSSRTRATTEAPAPVEPLPPVRRSPRVRWRATA